MPEALLRRPRRSSKSGWNLLLPEDWLAARVLTAVLRRFTVILEPVAKSVKSRTKTETKSFNDTSRTFSSLPLDWLEQIRQDQGDFLLVRREGSKLLITAAPKDYPELLERRELQAVRDARRALAKEKADHEAQKLDKRITRKSSYRETWSKAIAAKDDSVRAAEYRYATLNAKREYVYLFSRGLEEPFFTCVAATQKHALKVLRDELPVLDPVRDLADVRIREENRWVRARERDFARRIGRELLFTFRYQKHVAGAWGVFECIAASEARAWKVLAAAHELVPRGKGQSLVAVEDVTGTFAYRGKEGTWL